MARLGMRRLILFAAATTAIWPACAFAAGLQITPLRAMLTPSNLTAAFTLTNGTGAPVLMQLHAKRWTQGGGKDKLDDTDELLAAPPIFNMASGATQVIRVGLRHAVADPGERTYRLIIAQVPTTVNNVRGVSFVTTLSLPIFVEPATVLRGPSLEWTATTVGRSEISLRVENKGDEHVHIARLILYGDMGRTQKLYEATPGAYVLAGQWSSWRIKPAKPPTGSAVTIDAVLDTNATLHAVAPLR
jgi:fimbrial chaperone protein